MKMASIVIVVLRTMLPAADAGQANTSQEPFTITVAADNPEVNAGSNTCVKVSLTNNSSEDLHLSGGAGGYTNLDPNYRFEVRDEGGNPPQRRIYARPEIFKPTTYTYTLRPNETHDQDQCPSALYEMRKPGHYTIQVFRQVSDNDPLAGEVASNIVDVTVIPAPSGGQPPSSIIVAPLKPSFRAGSNVCVGISFTNNTSQNLSMNFAIINGVSSEFRFEIRDENGNLLSKVNRPDIGSFEGGGGAGLKPGDTAVHQECPSRQYDMTTPGKYTIQVFRHIPNDGEIGSNTVTVTVEP